jgi:hypothetical protein
MTDTVEPVADLRIDAMQFRLTTLERDAADMFLWLSLIIGLTLGIAVAAAVRRG